MPTEMHHNLPVTGVDHKEEIEQDELRGFSRTLAGIEWLLAILVMLYLKLPGTLVDNELAILSALVVFVLFIIVFHYMFFKHTDIKWKLAVETWAMIAFITFVLWQTGKIESPLVSLYFLVIITAATTLGKKITLLEVGLISACCLLLSFSPSVLETFSVSRITGPLIQLFPFWLVAYLITMLSRESRLAKVKIQHLSQTDYLTGLWNMRMFSSLLQKECERSARYKHPFAILMLDADNLKPVNDTHGHEAGSNMIKLLAKTIQEQLRSSDTIARFGGDEFVALLAETDCSKAAIAAERIRHAVENTPLIISGETAGVTVSIGIAGFPDHGIAGEEIMNKADKALYQCKRSGKNRAAIVSE